MLRWLKSIGFFLLSCFVMAAILFGFIYGLYYFLPKDVNVSVKDAEYIATDILISSNYFSGEIENAYVYLAEDSTYDFSSCWVEVDGEYYDGKYLKVVPEDPYDEGYIPEEHDDYEPVDIDVGGYQAFYIIVQGDSKLSVYSYSGKYNFPAVYIRSDDPTSITAESISVIFQNEVSFGFKGYVDLYNGFEDCFMITDSDKSINADEFEVAYEGNIYDRFEEIERVEITNRAFQFGKCRLYPKKDRYYSWPTGTIKYYPWSDKHPTREERREELQLKHEGKEISQKDYENLDEPPVGMIEMHLGTDKNSVASIHLAEVNNIHARIDGILFKSYPSLT